ncbi:SDR family oxidoreductase [Marinomonas mediterranea]|uniref:SDR family oxidoreductase n=1 Tax=Marinomonas mediterranea TaxID=119864 RepID=UPI002349B4DA|nr:NAD(P)H-binding protein [Marinomonas mediterranea]WCN09024.1 NAD(P)H-binding protein [Marinomonas mediterranea]
MKQHQYAIIGASGKTGVRVNQRLHQAGYIARALSRNTDIPFDWTQPSSTWNQALEGVDALYITFQPDLAIPDADTCIEQLVDVAKHEGIKHLILLSGRGEEGAEKAEKIVQSSGLSWNIVRASWFMQNFSESFMLDGVLSGQLVLPKTEVPEPFIDVDDIADVVFELMTTTAFRNQLIEVTGPTSISFQECVDEINKTINTSIQYIPVDIDSYLKGASEQGMPEGMLWLLKELFTEVLDGRNVHTTNGVERVLKRKPSSFKDYVVNTAKSGVWN